jgi:cytochrome c biogenesis protein CcdA/thiol-disulfide isomerase/thioredoxin
MVLLVLFALLAGAGTAVSPCVLPVLPALLSAGATGGRRRPLGIVVGLAATFTLTVIGLASLVDGVGQADGAVRTAAIVVLLAFGVLLLAPPLADRLEAALSPLARLGPRGRGDGFWSGMGVGAALGFVYAPCAGPILAAVISVAATQGASARLVAIALAYALGSAVVLLLLALGGRRVADHIRRAGRGPALQRATGAVLILTAAAMLAQLDVGFQTRIAGDLPAVVVNPTRALEDSSAVERRLAGLRGAPRFAPAPARADGTTAGAARLPVLGRAPAFRETQRWFNTPGGRPLTLAGLRGRVVLLDFWTYTCINCLRTLPELEALDRRYRAAGLTVVGVHTPEFSFERDASNVAAAIRRTGVRYPVVQDNAYGTWDAWGNQYWPAQYLVDARGNVRATHFGEGGEAKTEAAIRSLLAEAGARRLGPTAHPHVQTPSARLATPETYLGAERAQGWLPDGGLSRGRRRFARAPQDLPLNTFALTGTWTVGSQATTAIARAGVAVTFQARRVYLVLSSRGDRPRSVRVRVDGRPAEAADVRHGRLTARGQRLYELVDLPRAGRHRLDLSVAPGVSGYAFTFG